MTKEHAISVISEHITNVLSTNEHAANVTSTNEHAEDVVNAH